MASLCQPDPPQIEYDFVEQPSQDFFCPVSLELLTEPHLLACCGHHLSQQAAQRLQRDRKPCPMCHGFPLSTMPDKFFKRKVNELKTRCSHKISGCGWVGELSELKRHLESCPLEPVACEYAEVGCNVKVPRRDLARHMEEGQQQHLLSATLLNLRLTRENTEERNRLHRTIQGKDEEIRQLQNLLVRLQGDIADLRKHIAVKDQCIKERDERIKESDKVIAKKDETIADLQKQHEQIKSRLEAKVTNLQQQVVNYGEDTQKHLTQQDQNVESMFYRSAAGLLQRELPVRRLQGFTVQEFILGEFSKYQAKGGYGDWFGEPYYSHPGGYKFQLRVDTNGDLSVRKVYMTVYFKLLKGDRDDKLEWPITHTAHVQLLNQLGDHRHHEKTSTYRWSKKGAGGHGGHIVSFIKLTELGHSAGKNTQYLKDDCLHFRVCFNARPNV